MGIICIRNLKLSVFLGVYEWEQKAPRPVVATIRLSVDLTKASMTDNLSDTVDYGALSEKIIETYSTESPNNHSAVRYALIEKLAGDIAETCLDFDYRIENVRINISKPGAIPAADTVEVEVEFHK